MIIGPPGADLSVWRTSGSSSQKSALRAGGAQLGYQVAAVRTATQRCRGPWLSQMLEYSNVMDPFRRSAATR